MNCSALALRGIPSRGVRGGGSLNGELVSIVSGLLIEEECEHAADGSFPFLQTLESLVRRSTSFRPTCTHTHALVLNIRAHLVFDPHGLL